MLMEEFAAHAWWVRVATKPKDKWFAAAFEYADAAEGAVRVRLDLPNDILVQAHGAVRQQEITKMKLQDGDVQKYG